MAYTDINSEDRLVQAAFADHLRDELGWESVYAWNDETFGPVGTLGRTDTDKDPVTIEETFARLVELVNGMNAEDQRAAEEGLSEDEYALFCMLQKENISKSDREKVKLASRSLYAALCNLIEQRERWTEKEQTQSRS